VAELGGIIFPPVPALYGRPESVDEIIEATAGRILARLGFSNTQYPEWRGLHVRDGALETESM
jgi:flavin prenyltransferase